MKGVRRCARPAPAAPTMTNPEPAMNNSTKSAAAACLIFGLAAAEHATTETDSDTYARTKTGWRYVFGQASTHLAP
jgi:hypothetical protein